MNETTERLIESVWIAVCPHCGAESRWICLGEGECPECLRAFVRVTVDMPPSTVRFLQQHSAAKDRELVDWFEENVISCTDHPLGWEILLAGFDREPATEQAVLYKADTLREAWAMAKAAQEAGRLVLVKGAGA